MRDFHKLHALLSSLSRITRLNFQVWDANGLVFSSGADMANASDVEAYRAFSARIMTDAAYQCAPDHGPAPMFGAPIRYGQDVIGSVIAYDLSTHPVSQSKDRLFAEKHDPEEAEAFLTDLTGLIEEAWANQKELEEMAEELSQSFENLSLYARISSQLKLVKFSGPKLKTLVEELAETMSVDLAFIDMPNRPEYNAVVDTTGLSDKTSDQKRFAHSLIQAIPPTAPSLGQDYFIVNDSTTTTGFKALHPKPYRFLVVKMGDDSHFDGCLGLVSFNMEEIFRQGELMLLQSMAKQVSVLLTNMDLYHELRHFVINMVKSLVHAIEAKDIYTRGHSERVNRFAMLMAERLELDETQKEMLNWASILHDIGKIGIPEGVLNKPGPLDDEESKIIKGHPEKGHSILEPLEQLSSSLPGILHHHERLDGNGYPHGLKGDDIPFFARIIAVADTFDAMTSSRAYRSAKSPEEALAIMEQVAGSQLDPDLLEVFKEVFGAVLTQELETSYDEQGCGVKAIQDGRGKSRC